MIVTSPSNPLLKVLIPVLALFLIFFLVKRKRVTAAELSIKAPKPGQVFFWLGIWLIFMLGTDYLFHWRGDFDFTSWKAQPLWVSICRVMGVGVFGPVAEEFIFRGFLFARIKKQVKNEWMAMLLVTFLWAIIHLEYNIPIIALIFVNGLLLGTSLLKTRSIFIPILLHIVWNLYAVW